MRKKSSRLWRFAKHHTLRLWRKGSDGWLPFVVGMMFLATVIMYMTIARATRIVVGWMQGDQGGEQTSTPPIPAPTQTTDSKWFDISPFTNLSMVWQVSIAITTVVFLALVVTGILYLIQTKGIKESSEGGDKKPSDGTKPPAPPTKDWKERYKEIEEKIKKIEGDIAQIRNHPYMYFVWVIIGWLAAMGVLWVLYPELPTWNWIFNKHFILFWSTPFIVLIGMWFYKNKSWSVKAMGLIAWAPLGYLWITAIASDVDFSGWRNQFQSVSTSTASGATNYHYKDKHGNPFVDIPVPASGHWSQPYEFRGNERASFDSNVPIEVMPNGDKDLIKPHAPAEDGPHYPANVRISIVQFRSTTGKDGIVQMKLIYAPR